MRGRTIIMIIMLIIIVEPCIARAVLTARRSYSRSANYCEVVGLKIITFQPVS